MRALRDFGTVESATITVLVDNRADMIVKSTEQVAYHTDGPLVAEHGFAVLVTLQPSGLRVLWDTGATPGALLENARRMKVDLRSIQAIALSHGHWDHTGGLIELLRVLDRRPKAREWPAGTALADVDAWMRSQRVPLYAHPAAFRERWKVDREGRRLGPTLPPSEPILAALGAEVITSESPERLAPGCWATGYVPRVSFETSGRSSNAFFREGDDLVPDDIADDQALILNLQAKGLVVVAGCAHAGIVNTVTYAQEITGVGRVYAVLGGFHLARATDDEVEQTLVAAKRWGAEIVAPSHCTGFGPICRFAREMPEPFVPAAVGVTYRL
jgi:7,8-dihydropterin-6-yl-methyl-4-(beta-D-ribofuranosyl)aminobenzene 5'-phosphate synthase